MQNIPSSYVSLQPTPALPKKERGIFFTLVLGLQTLLALAGTFLWIMGGAAVDNLTREQASLHDVHRVTSRVILAAAIFQILKLVSLMGIWAWKRWALLLYYASTVLAMVAVSKITGTFSFWELTWPALMTLGIFPRLSMFQD